MKGVWFEVVFLGVGSFELDVVVEVDSKGTVERSRLNDLEVDVVTHYEPVT